MKIILVKISISSLIYNMLSSEVSYWCKYVRPESSWQVLNNVKFNFNRGTFPALYSGCTDKKFNKSALIFLGQETSCSWSIVRGFFSDLPNKIRIITSRGLWHIVSTCHLQLRNAFRMSSTIDSVSTLSEMRAQRSLRLVSHRALILSLCRCNCK